MQRADKMSLKAFWDAVERRLAACSADELRGILRGIAQETPPPGRQAFLGKLKPVAETAAAVQKAMGQDDLLADVDDLASELKTAMDQAKEPWEDDHDWHGHDDYGEYDEEDSLEPYEGFIEPLTVLFDRTEGVFDHGHLKLAREAYQKLFEVLGLEDDYGRGIRVDDLDSIEGGETVARYLRAVYETEKPARRPKALFEQMLQARSQITTLRPTLSDIIEISIKPLPDYDRFIEDWIVFLQKQDGSEADVWLREAIRLSRGTAGLEELARAEGKKRPRAYLDWFTALESEGKHREALVAAQEALQALPAKLPIRAAVADHLCAAATRLKETAALRVGRWEAFLVKPTLRRLLDLWNIASDEKERVELMQQAAQHAQNYIAHPSRRQETYGVEWHQDNLEATVWIDKSVLAHAYLLAGDWDAAHQLAAQEKTLGWSSSDNPQGLVVPFFLVLLSGKPLAALPSNLAQLWQRALSTSVGFGEWDDENEEGNKATKRLERTYTERLANASLTTDQQKELLSWCQHVAMQRTDDIVGNQHRGSYGKAAELTAACAETLQLQGETGEADAFLDDARNRFPRHRAFQSELDAATLRMGRSLKRKR